MTNLIEQFSHQAEGYHPLLIRPQWQVAILNYSDAESLEAIDKLDIHHHTDESFVLLAGRSVLIAAAIEGDEISYQTIDMREGVVYNIPANVWHKIAMQPASRVLVVENPNTHLGDFEFHELSKAQKSALETAVLGNN